ncbi:MAG: beta-lactamase family protein [Desulfobacteraceae bacterium]|nr:beta-lactamase family protein [Desulfobacteraceae bacterium]
MKYSKKAIWLFVFVFCLALAPVSGCGGGKDKDYSATIDQITTLIEQRMQENEVMGLSIALVDGQEVVWSQGFGYADKENDIKATAETIYEIGSVSKTITATAIMHARDKGHLDIDDHLTKYLPEFSILPPLGFDPQPDKPITVRSMLTHHSGIPGNLLNGAFTLEPRTDYTAWLLDYFRTDYACFPPNFVYAYSNSAYSLLADVVAAASGKSFEAYTDNMFEIMGMRNTSYFLHKLFLKENRARGYYNGKPLDHFYNAKWGAGSVYSNVLDMAKYIKMINGHGQGEKGQLLLPETLEKMLTPQDLGIALDAVKWNREGLGWGLSDPELEYAGRVCGHDGATIGFCSHLEILLDHELGVIVSSNSDQKNALMVLVEVGRETLKLALKDKMGIDPVKPSGPTYSPCTSRPQEQLDALEGVYVTNPGYDMIKALPGELKWTDSEGKIQKLSPLENGRFALPLENGRCAPPNSQEFQIEFATISGRDVMIQHWVYTNVRGERYDAVPTPAVWHDRLGEYEITNLNPQDSTRFIPEKLWAVIHSVELAENDGMLVLRFALQDTRVCVVIEPHSETVALIRGLGDDKGGAVQIVTVDGQEQIQLWGSLYKR